jgi:serine/threonine protein kinase
MTMDDSRTMRTFVGTAIVDRYRLEQFLDEGMFGAVYKATQVAYEVELREVAIKIAKQPMTYSEARRVFGDALLMARVADTIADVALRQHFVTVYDAGRCPEGGPLAGHPYVVMELVRGGSLKRSLRAGPFPLTRAMAYFEQLLQVMACMHGGVTRADGRSHPIIHRDLKPSNILVSRRQDGPDVLKITDFGLAVEVDALLGWVESGGDLAYLAPESFSHNICSPQSDVYMLGLVFYEMLTQTTPFAEVGNHLRGTDKEKRAELRRLHLAARQMEQFALLEHHEELRQHPKLAKVIRTALQVDMPARTYANACELKSAWEQAQTADNGPLLPPEPPWKTVRRLTGEAEQCFAVGDDERGETLLRQAMTINQDRNRVPDPMVVGRSYLLMVQRLLYHDKTEDAGRLALEGYQRRTCCSTCRAVARYYDARQSPLGARFDQEAETCPDQE